MCTGSVYIWAAARAQGYLDKRQRTSPRTDTGPYCRVLGGHTRTSFSGIHTGAVHYHAQDHPVLSSPWIVSYFRQRCLELASSFRRPSLVPRSARSGKLSTAHPCMHQRTRTSSQPKPRQACQEQPAERPLPPGCHLHGISRAQAQWCGVRRGAQGGAHMVGAGGEEALAAVAARHAAVVLASGEALQLVNAAKLWSAPAQRMQSTPPPQHAQLDHAEAAVAPTKSLGSVWPPRGGQPARSWWRKFQKGLVHLERSTTHTSVGNSRALAREWGGWGGVRGPW